MRLHILIENPSVRFGHIPVDRIVCTVGFRRTFFALVLALVELPCGAETREVKFYVTYHYAQKISFRHYVSSLSVSVFAGAFVSSRAFSTLPMSNRYTPPTLI